MNVIVHTRTKKAGLDKKLGFVYADSLEELLQRSDFVSLHCPATNETKNLVDSNFLNHMKEDAVLINTARGTCINEAHLLARLEQCPNFWFGTDVF